MRFKVGDVVQVLKDRACATPVKKGDTGTIVEVNNTCYDYLVQMNDGASWYFRDEYIEHIGQVKFDHQLEVKVKKLHPNAIIPSYAKPGDAGMDLTATSKWWDPDLQCVVYGTGLAFEIPEGYVGLIFPRSSICKVPLMLSNSVGVIDCMYRGEVRFFFRPTDRPRKNYEVGDRIGQMIVMPFPKVKMIEVAELSNTERGTGGFGSSGK